MGRSAVPLDTIWPNGSDPKTLVCVRSQCSVADLFNTVFGEHDLSEQLHKQRGDTDLVDTPWYASKDALPHQLYTWQISDPPNKPSATLRHRKVRFKSPPTALASTPFNNEELQVVTELYPDTLYVVEGVSSTSAPYGDKFNVYFRYIFRADDTLGSSALHVLFHVEWLPAMNRMMRPVVGKAVDAGVRSTFRIFRTVLGTLSQSVTDIRETEFPSGGPPAVVSHEPLGEREEAAAGSGAGTTPSHPHPEAAPTAGFAPGLGPPPGLMSVMSQQLVYKDQVVLLTDLFGAGLRSVSASDLGAHALAAMLTIWLISLVIAALRGWQTLCVGTDTPSGGKGLLLLVRLAMCWPLALVDVPDSTTEVLVSLALVAAINWAVIRGTEAIVRYLSKAHPGILAAARGGGGAGGGGDVIGGVPFSQTPLLVSRRSSGGALSGGGYAAGNGGGNGASQLSSSLAARAPSMTAPTAQAASEASSTTGGSGGAGKEQDKGKGSFSSATSFFAAAMGAAAGTAAKSPAPSPSPTLAPAKPKPMRAAPAPKQFTAAQLRQLELGQVTITKKKTPTAALTSEPAAAPAPIPASVTPAVPAAAVMTDAWAADLPSGMVLPSGPSPAQRAPSPPPRAASPPTVKSDAATGTTTATATASAAPSIALDAASDTTAAGTGTRSTVTVEHASAKLGDGSGGGLGPGTVAPVPPTPAPAPSGRALAVPHAAQQFASGWSTTSQAAGQVPSVLSASSTFANMFTREGIDSMAESLRSAFRWETPKITDLTELGSPESTSPSVLMPQHLPILKARSDSGGVFAGDAIVATAAPAAGAAAGTAAGARRGSGAGPPGQRSGGGADGGGDPHYFTMGAAQTSLSLYSARPDMPLLVPGEEDEYGGGDDGYYGEVEPSLVVEEVFENERFQPFRGWGHMWPGHFLPSDRVGHWSDRQGKPGGSASMIFEQVVPQLPPGWRWLENDWQVDLEGVDIEAVDPDGWTYALDFYLLKYPPPPQGGKCSLKHFVRRRRYYRTRVRNEAHSTHLSEDYGSSARVSETGAGEHPNRTPSDGAAPAPASAMEAAAAATDEPLGLQDRLSSLSEGIPSTSLLPGPPVGHNAACAPRDSTGTTFSVELQPSVRLSVAPPSVLDSTSGGGTRSHASAEGQPEERIQQQQQHEKDSDGRRSQRSSLTGSEEAGAQVKATLDLLSPGLVDARSVTDGPAKDVTALRHGQGEAGSCYSDNGGGGGGSAAAQQSEMFVMSPKTEVKSHDPLGALATGGTTSPDSPVAAATVAAKSTAIAAADDPQDTSSIAQDAAAGPALGSSPAPSSHQSVESAEEAALKAALPAVAPSGAAEGREETTSPVTTTASVVAGDETGPPNSSTTPTASAHVFAPVPDGLLIGPTAPKDKPESGTLPVTAGAAAPIVNVETGDSSSAPAPVDWTGPTRRDSLRTSQSARLHAKSKTAVEACEEQGSATEALSEEVTEGPIIAADLVE